jgi:hypothetical protein
MTLKEAYEKKRKEYRIIIRFRFSYKHYAIFCNKIVFIYIIGQKIRNSDNSPFLIKHYIYTFILRQNNLFFFNRIEYSKSL